MSTTIDLGGPKTISAIRRGEQLFNSAQFAFQGQFGCANCHLDATFDGMNGTSSRTDSAWTSSTTARIEDLIGTEPFKWNGGNPNMPTECGPRTEKYFYRSQSYNEQELTDLVAFVLSIPVRPNRYRLPDGELTAAQERGKAIFERTRNKDGKPDSRKQPVRLLPQRAEVHQSASSPMWAPESRPTARRWWIRRTCRTSLIPRPTCTTARRGRWKKSGRCSTRKDTHGVTNDLTKDELNDLIEYLRTL